MLWCKAAELRQLFRQLLILWFIFWGQKMNVLPLPFAKCVTILKTLLLVLLQANTLKPGVLVTSFWRATAPLLVTKRNLKCVITAYHRSTTSLSQVCPSSDTLASQRCVSAASILNCLCVLLFFGGLQNASWWRRSGRGPIRSSSDACSGPPLLSAPSM